MNKIILAITLLLSVLFIYCPGEDTPPPVIIPYEQMVGEDINIKECFNIISAKVQSDGYIFNCEDNEEVLKCYHDYLLNKEKEIIEKNKDVLSCISDEDCVLSDVPQGKCYSICPIAINKNSNKNNTHWSFLLSVWGVVPGVDFLCCIPKDTHNEKYDETKCMESGTKCKYYADCPYIKAVCDKDNGICVGVKE